jgi:hypothetical protein
VHGQRQLQLLSNAAALAVVLATPPALAGRVCAPPHGAAVVRTRAATNFEVRAGPGFFVVAGATTAADAACVSQKAANVALVELVERVDAELGIDPQIAVLLTAGSLACANLFYVPVENDVRGIGYEHEDGREVFDDSPASRLEGVAFLNDFPYWRLHPDEFRKDFAHEIGHRFGARVRAAGAGDALLGRESQHWSYFLDSAGSPLEGNAWTQTGASQYVADTPLALAGFSELDLYLMGSLPAAAVKPSSLLATSTPGTDCLGHPLTAASPPQSCGALTFDGSASTIDIEAVVQAEGARDPAPDPTPRTLDVAYFVLSSGSDFTRDECEALAAVLPERISDFSVATRGSLSLASLAEPNGSCELASEEPSSAAPSARAFSSGCHIGKTSRNAGCGGFVSALSLLLLGRRRKPRARGVGAARGELSTSV